jgi:hypothetical protein
MVAVGLLALGGLATARLLGVLSTTSNTVAGVTDGTTFATSLISEIMSAQYEPNTTPVPVVDPGLVPGVYNAPAPGSAITTVGNLPIGDPNPTMTASYEVVVCQLCNNPFNTGQTLGGLDILVTIQNVPGYTRLRAPINFYLRKETQATLVNSAQQRY